LKNVATTTKGWSNSSRKPQTRRRHADFGSAPNPRPLDRGLLLVILALLGIGLVQVYSSSFIFAIESRGGDGLYFFKRQLMFAMIAFPLLLSTALVPWRTLERWGFLLWVFAAGLVVMTLIPGIGHRAGGAARWVRLGSFRFEPAELLKIALPVVFATFMSWSAKWEGWAKWPIFTGALIGPIAILLLQPDFGTLVICSAVLLTLLFCFGLQRRYIFVATVTLLPLFYFMVMLVPYRRARILSFLDPWSDPGKSGFQVIQSLLSLYSGGLSGAGLGQGQGKLFFLPEAHTDFTLAVLGEEMGFTGVGFIIFLYAFLIFKGFQIAARAHSKFAQASALGLTVTFALQVIINMGVVMGLFPTKGLTLPFLSYGGSSLLMTCLLLGLLLNIGRYADSKK
jgi:cell division protein FtsW